MAINPTPPKGPRPNDAAAADPSRSPRLKDQAPARDQSARRAERAEPGGADRADVSVAARVLATGSGDGVPISDLAPERAQAIGERLATGYYERPEVLDEVARRLAADPARPLR